jgi:hypothetical protein
MSRMDRIPALAAIRRALEEALGRSFEGPRGEHSFRSTLVQTLFYGLFSSWMAMFIPDCSVNTPPRLSTDAVITPIAPRRCIICFISSPRGILHYPLAAVAREH